MYQFYYNVLVLQGTHIIKILKIYSLLQLDVSYEWFSLDFDYATS